ncbi:hypothetical protein CA236_02645 [Sphingomonas sp. ABOLG]|uniref:Uncharacterized protein n=1 Tax=Sphingomonas olei TaxID=1886787 RepID=A0ABY2QEF7_9SPHN|nr:MULTISPECIES: hypothetical protein [Sphingomonas]KKI18202.1 hypothetical protein XM50_12965 [Sphingomonas sp. Ag1]MDF2603870.1 hypothetical protein [Sphingomonas sp.]RSV20089.1 hypothetical protein CA236_02645 [Sphingomonas sp. ABOLG]THG38612.1 hypothetical protein E5988_13545 [Sphingomonas olei]
MTDERVTETSTPNTTIIERRGGGGGMLIGLAVLLAVVVAAFFLFNQSKNDNMETRAISSAAKSVGDTADKAGAAIEGATK